MTNTLGSHIRTHRKKQGFTLKELSELCEISIPYLSDIERDVVNPSISTLQSIAPCLDLSLPQIVDYNNELEHRLITENITLRNTIRDIKKLIDYHL